MGTKELIKKYNKGKTTQQMIEEQDKLEKEYTARSAELEQALDDFSKKTDKLKVPKTNKVLAIVRRPTSDQFRKIVPPEMAKYRANPEKIPYELAVKYEDNLYKLMEELIDVPRHDARWWRENTGASFIVLFQSHLMKINEKVRKDAESFLPRSLDSQS